MDRLPVAALVAVILAGGGATAHAEHGDPWLGAFPVVGAELARNGRVVLLAHNGPHALVTEPWRFRYRLRAPHHTISLRPARAGRGSDWDGYGASYLVLEPVRRLVGEREYGLEARVGGAWRAVEVAAPLDGPTALYGGRTRPARWRARRPDGRAPRWAGDPRREVNDYGSTQLTLDLEDANPIALQVVAHAAGAPTFDVVTQHAPVFGVVDGCSSVLLDGNPRRVRVTPFDPSGNRGRTRTLVVRAGEELILCVNPPSPDDAP